MISYKYILPIFVILILSVAAMGGQHKPVLNVPNLKESQKKSAHDFLDLTDSLNLNQRQEIAVDWILDGNIPDYIKKMTPVIFVNSKKDTATVWATNDYLSVGNNQYFLRIPLSLPSAQVIANQLGMYLPTSVMVDSIYAQASIQLAPQPMKPGKQMRSNDYYQKHHKKIEEQILAKNSSQNRLIAGHKKDVVVTNEMKLKPGKVAIYGWYRGNQDPIQPLSLVHGKNYEDYSHGLRLIYPVAKVKDQEISLKKLLKDENWSLVLSEEKGIDIESLSHGIK